VRPLLRLASSAVLLLSLMLAGSLVLWVAIPLAWLWVASRIQDATGSVGLALLAALAGVVASILAMIPVLSWLSAHYREARVARGLDDSGNLALEVVLVVSAGLALVGFGIWFFGFSGSAPIPIGPPS
jgi:hypothetical protein